MDQLYLGKGSDLRFVRELDPKLWVVLSCPTSGIEFEERTLQLIDQDADGRIRYPELVKAVEWTLHMLKDPEILAHPEESLPLQAIDASHEEGRKLLDAAQRILKNLNLVERESLTLSDALNTAKIYAESKENGDGVIPPETAEDKEVRWTIEDILGTVGGEEDRSGRMGVTLASVDSFYSALEDYKRWWGQGLATEGDDLDGMLPFGPETEEAYAAYRSVKDKIEDYFSLCRLAEFDRRFIDGFGPSPNEIKYGSEDIRKELANTLGDYPLAHVDPEKGLPLLREVNPNFRSAVSNFNEATVKRIFGERKDYLNENEWRKVKGRLGKFEKWQEGKSGQLVEKLGIDRIKECLEQNHRMMLEELIRSDLESAADIENIAEVERLLRYRRDLFRLLNNFVALREFYDVNSMAIFQAGTLFMDGRGFQLCLSVDDAKKHVAIARQAGVFLIYCRIGNQQRGVSRTIVAAVTAGSGNRLAVGKNGVFRDLKGVHWEATIIQIVSHPISLKEAVWAPFRRLGELIAAQFEKISASQEKSIRMSVEKSAASIDKGVSQGPSQVSSTEAPGQPVRESGSSGIGGILAGGGVAVAALCSSFAFISSTVSRINNIYFFYTAVVFLLFIILPSLCFGLLKLRKRDLSLILDAGGWAINGPMHLNLSLARSLTQLSSIPTTARYSLSTESERRPWQVQWWIWALFAIALVELAIVWLG